MTSEKNGGTSALVRRLISQLCYCFWEAVWPAKIYPRSVALQSCCTTSMLSVSNLLLPLELSKHNSCVKRSCISLMNWLLVDLHMDMELKRGGTLILPLKRKKWRISTRNMSWQHLFIKNWSACPVNKRTLDRLLRSPVASWLYFVDMRSNSFKMYAV